MNIWITALLALTVTTPICASEPAARALAAGDYASARTLGQTSRTAKGLMTACRAGMLLGGYYEAGEAAIKSLHTAANDCLGVIKQDNRHVNARITLAIVIGFEGKRWRRPSLATQSKRLLQQTHTDFPDSPAAQGALGGWHSEVSAAGFLARLYLGARRGKAGQYFAGAITKGEHSAAFYLEYVKFLARGKKVDRALAREVAKTILSQPPNDAIDRLMQQKIAEIRAALNTGDKAEIKKAIAAATAFNGIKKWRTIPVLQINLPE